VNGLRSVDDHLRRVLADLRVPEPIELALLDAQGLLCAADVRAGAPRPGFDNSQMDG
jgi:molybdopterin molybdotransferase